MSSKKEKLQETQARRHSFTNPAFAPAEEDPVPELRLDGGQGGGDGIANTSEDFYDDVNPNTTLADDGTYDNEGPQERPSLDPHVSEDQATYDVLPADNQMQPDSADGTAEEEVGEEEEVEEDDAGDTFAGFTTVAPAPAPARSLATNTQGYMAVETTTPSVEGYVAVEVSNGGIPEFDEETSEEEI